MINFSFLLTEAEEQDWYDCCNVKHTVYRWVDDAIEAFNNYGGKVNDNTYWDSWGGECDEVPIYTVSLHIIELNTTTGETKFRLLKTDDISN